MQENRKYRIDFDGQKDHALQYLLGMLKDARQTTLQLTERLLQEEIDWQYQPGWNTIGALLDHIAAIEHYFRIEFIEERKLSEAENEQLIAALDMGIHLPKLIGIKTVEDYSRSLTESGAMLVEALNGIGFEQFTKRIDDYDEVEGCNLAWALYHMMEDEIYHRGQISMLRKLYKESVG